MKHTKKHHHYDTSVLAKTIPKTVKGFDLLAHDSSILFFGKQPIE